MSRLLHILRQSGLCLDRPRLLDWTTAAHWRRVLFFRLLRLRFSPAVLESPELSQGPLEERGRLFSLAASHLNVGRTYKTTAQGRTRLADQALLRLARNHDAVRLLDVGCSDGTSSLDLVRDMENLEEYVPADLHSVLWRRGHAPLEFFLDGQRRLLGVKCFCFYFNLGGYGPVRSWAARPISTLNPLLAARPDTREPLCFDLFQDMLDRPVQLIKCANLLNREYFSDQGLRAGALNLARSLAPGGALVVSQNNNRYEGGEACVVLVNDPGGLKLEQDQGGHPLAGLFPRRDGTGGQA